MTIGNIFFFALRKSRAFLVAGVLAVLLASCDDDDTTALTPVPVGYLSVYHASPDAPAVDIVVDNRTINNAPFDYSDYSGYLNFYTGSRNFKITPVNAASALIDTTFNVADGKVYSLFVINRLSNIEALVVVNDSFAAPAPGKAMVRFVNLSPDAPAVTLQADDNAIFAGTAFKKSTDFVPVDAKTYSFEVASPNGEQLVSASDVALHPGQFYTIITRGFVTPPQGNTAVLSLEVLP